MKSLNILQARSSFVVLQILDLLDLVTTLAAFHFGALEVNPLVGHLASLFGPIGGVVVSKLVAVLIAFRVRRLTWVVNLLYGGVVCWNTMIVFALSHARR